PRGSVFGYMPELNVLCAIADHSEQSGQPLTKQLIVEVTPAVTRPCTIEPASPPTSWTHRLLISRAASAWSRPVLLAP
ncbi:MAG: hypothetical protein QOF66_364, partial [Mycobacterium sp.]|uniref:hypothetical protein n=1 Tax=Mycobacterium sp. TaxID=1785 RepID=UPI0028B638D4|nr:hypothetical protein [Mycobacterium sp.]